MIYALVGIAALLMLIYISVASRNLATLSIQGPDLVVTMRGLNTVWAVKNKVVIPRALPGELSVESGYESLVVPQKTVNRLFQARQILIYRRGDDR